ncbi:Mll2356 protein [hydrothermal vent metagenome]|uniref:Mll2356 protein n=1 Tax=hydrothermal vent metagenome TaxID=652676 RepID=A0A3B0ZAC6_9ZZZZ
MNEETLEIVDNLVSEQKINGVVIGVLLGFSDKSKPLVAFPGNKSETGIAANTTSTLSSDDVGKKMALLFEGGDPGRPIVIGRIQHPEEIIQPKKEMKSTVDLDGDRLEFNAKKEIVLRCGKASITLTKAGKIILRGTYLLSRSSGVNRIKGGSVQIN